MQVGARALGVVLIFLSHSGIGQTPSRPANAPDAIASVVGAVQSLDTASLTLKTIDGKIERYALPMTASIIRVGKRTVADLKPGQFVGCISVASSGAIRRAIDLHIMSESGGGNGEGHRLIDANRANTTGSIESATSSPRGKMLTIGYQGGSQQIEVSVDIPIVAMESMTRAQLKPGELVTLLLDQKVAGNGAVRTVMLGQMPAP